MTLTKTKSSPPVFLVTGGASPIGQAISRQIVLEGGAVAIHYQRSKQRAEALCRTLQQEGAEAFPFACDLNRPKEAGLMVRRVIRRWGRLNALVNNASLFKPTPLGRSQMEVWENIIRVNTISPYFLSEAAYPWLRRAKGVIVHITDIYGTHPILKDHSAYCASKAALVGLTRFMAREMGPDVRVNAVSPGAIVFPKSYTQKRQHEILRKTSLKRVGRPEDIAAAVLFLAHNPFVTGQVLDVDGGRFSG